MNRRNFLQNLAIFTATLAVNPELKPHSEDYIKFIASEDLSIGDIITITKDRNNYWLKKANAHNKDEKIVGIMNKNVVRYQFIKTEHIYTEGKTRQV